MRVCRRIACVVAVCTYPAHGVAQRSLHAVSVFQVSGSSNDLTHISALVPNRVGGVFALQPADYRILGFDRLGRATWAFGRKGGGPGEFLGLGQMVGVVADTVIIPDAGANRMTWLGPGLQFIRTEALPQEVHGPAGSDAYPGLHRPMFIGTLPDGSFIARIEITTERVPPVWLPVGRGDGVIIARIAAKGELVRVLARGSSSADGKCNGHVGTTMFLLPFCQTPSFTIGQEARILAAVTPLPDGSARLVVIDVISGDTISTTRQEIRKREIPTKVIDSVRQRVMHMAGLPPEVAAAYHSLSFPKVFPPVARVVVGRDDTIWLEETTAPTALRYWRVVSRRGTVLGTLELPRNNNLLAADADHIWCTGIDSDGFENIYVYRVN